jgi:16S rRNA G527 N7-methylase RsmG
LGYDVIAIESIRKKTDFLNTLKTELDLPNLTVYHGRVEDFIKSHVFQEKSIKFSGFLRNQSKKAGVFDKNTQKNRLFDDKKEVIFTARAFAPLIRILDYTFSTKNRLYLLKGREIMSEIDTAKQKYKFNYELIPSKTGDGFIAVISDQ